MIFKKIVVGPLQVNCYLIADEKTQEAMVVDPGGDEDKILTFLKQNKLKLKYIVNTHCHFDHAGGNKRLKEETKAELLIHEFEVPFLDTMGASASLWGYTVPASPKPDRLLHDGDKIQLGGIEFDVLHIPGHSPGGICLKFSNKVISGDALFAGGIGRTDFPGGDYETLITAIKEKLFVLAESTEVYPGHGPATSIHSEKAFNPFF